MTYEEILEYLKQPGRSHNSQSIKLSDIFKEIIRLIKNNAISSFQLNIIAKKLAYLKEWKLSEELTTYITDEGDREEALTYLTDELADIGLPEEAGRILKLIPIRIEDSEIVYSRIKSLVKIVESFLRLNQVQSALERLNTVENLVNRLENNEIEKAYFQNKLAEIWINLEQKQRAINLWIEAMKIAEQALINQKAKGIRIHEELNAFRVIACAAAQGVGIKLAKEIANLIQNEAGKEVALKGISSFEEPGEDSIKNNH